MSNNFRTFALYKLSVSPSLSVCYMVDFSCKYQGVMYLVSNVGTVTSFSYGFNDVEYARNDVRFWLLERLDLCFVSVVVGSVLVAKAGVFPWHNHSVSLAPLGC